MKKPDGGRPAGLRIEPYGETALIILTGAGIDESTCRWLAALSAAIKKACPDGLLELIPAYDSLLLVFNPLSTDTRSFEAAIRPLIEGLKPVTSSDTPLIVEVPVVYGGEFGPDLDALAAKTGLSARQVIEMHSSKPYLVSMIGFSPGFPYLGGMDHRIASPRLATPRTAVPAGSVGIAGSQTGIYPQQSPGGWNLIGRTPLNLFDTAAQPPALLSAGQYVRFVPVSKDLFSREPSRSPKVPASISAETSIPGITILEPGPCSTIQDIGRFGFQDVGVPPSGPMDPWSMRLAIMLAGGEKGDAVIECALGGLQVRFDGETAIAVVGADVPLFLDGCPADRNRGITVGKGSVLSLGMAANGRYAYLAVRGGLSAESVLGSRSTFLRGGFGGLGGRRLAGGDFIPLAGAGSKGGRDADSSLTLPESYVPCFPAECVVRALPSHERDRFSREALASFFGHAYRVSPKSDRMGCRLEGAALAHVRGADIVSSGVVAGTVQVPLDGQPIVLMADRQTCGGYARIAHVIQADLGIIGQAGPGTLLRFAECCPAEAREALMKREMKLEALIKSLKPEPRMPGTRLRSTFRVTVDGVAFDASVEELQ